MSLKFSIITKLHLGFHVAVGRLPCLPVNEVCRCARSLCNFSVQSNITLDERKWEEMSQEAGRQNKLGMTRHPRFQMCECVCLCLCSARKLQQPVVETGLKINL